MKFRTGLVGLISILLVMCLFSGRPSYAQSGAQTAVCYGRVITTLDFRNPVYVTGTGTGPLTTNAVYRFSNVNTGIDALVRIVAFSGGATLATIDNNAILTPNFQPELVGSGARAVDFTITFVATGTSTPVAFNFTAGAIDVDGDSANIREYVEFSNALAEFTLNNPTRLVVNGSGPASPARTRFEAGTPEVAPGIDPTEPRNIVAVYYSSASTFQYRIGTLGTGNTTRLTSLDFNCPVFGTPVSTTALPQDFGDAPASYGNPRHDIVAGIQLGTAITAESGPYNHPTASADSGDDGITLTALPRGASASLTANVSGSGGQLQAWIDWNRDGDFLDAGEQIALNQRDNQPGDADAVTNRIRIDFTVPANANVGASFVRARWSTQANLPANTIAANNGEVEDYPVTIVRGPAILQVEKTSVLYDPSNTGVFALPGEDVTYTVVVRNTGTDVADNNSVFVLDILPPSLEFLNGDADGPGPGTTAALFTQTGSGLTFNAATDLRYSNLAAQPTNFAACAYTPVAGYDPAIRYICIRPQGTFAAGSPSPTITLRYRARIR